MEEGGTLDITVRIIEGDSTVEIVQTDTGHDLSEYIKEGSTMGGTKFAEKGKIGGASYFIAQAVASQHKGLLEVVPTGGKGTKFRIRLPLDFNKVAG
jgi:sensor histidine kinase regulating citrate/malate metabolism